MNLNAINGVTNTTKSVADTSPKTKKNDNDTSSKTGFSDTAAVYEKSSEETKVTAKRDNSAIVAMLKEDAETRRQQLISIVQQTIASQGATLGKADSIWSFLAKGDFTVTPEVKAQAEADIAEDGYWGVEQTSNRILEFAKALSGGDSTKADELFAAFKKGFELATGTWGKELPQLCQDTYKAVEEKFNAWKAETETV